MNVFGMKYLLIHKIDAEDRNALAILIDAPHRCFGMHPGFDGPLVVVWIEGLYGLDAPSTAHRQAGLSMGLC